MDPNRYGKLVNSCANNPIQRKHWKCANLLHNLVEMYSIIVVIVIAIYDVIILRENGKV